VNLDAKFLENLYFRDFLIPLAYPGLKYFSKTTLIYLG
jgi:hypothetical protein